MADRLVLKENSVFMVSSSDGDVLQSDQNGYGMYYKDTRYLSILETRVNGYTPFLLTSSGEYNFIGNIQCANPLMRIEDDNGQTVTLLPRTISIRHNRFIEDGLHERLGFYNYNPFPVKLTLSLRFGADFRDMFDVRGYDRKKRGTIFDPEWDGRKLLFRYLGLDNLERTTQISFDVPPTEVTPLKGLISSTGQVAAQRASLPHALEMVDDSTVQPAAADVTFTIQLEPQTPFAITYHVVPQGIGGPLTSLSESFDMGARRMRGAYEEWLRSSTRISTDNEIFNAFMERGIFDLRILMQELPTGLFPVAGIPWFAVPFGRDALITALQCLIFDPQIAVGTLRFLAQHQGREVKDWNEEQPGKILHELREGEMTVLHEMPQVPYYGSVDSTPLFILLFVQTMRWLDDAAFYREMLPHIRAGLNWIKNYGDMDGDGFIEYKSHNERGVKHHGWKDSANSLLDRKGQTPPAPIALVEAQGYVYAAKMGLADIAEQYGDKNWASSLRQEALTLKRDFNAKFWMPEAKFYAQALDRDKNQIVSITSNPGHALWCGIVDDDKIGAVVERLMADDMCSGWGLRTLATTDPAFNPMSYHNGSIWPHDNALIAKGFELHGYKHEADRVISQIFEAAQRFEYYRLPELFCGFPQDTRYRTIPAEYPVSCSPQAWTAGAGLLFIETVLGLQVNARAKQITLRPHLPSFLEFIQLEHLKVDGQLISLRVTRKYGHSYRLEVGAKPNDFEIKIIGG